VLVYIREAHPDSVLFTIAGGKEQLLKIKQTTDLEAREETANQCLATLKLTLPTVLDREDNRANHAYAGWPDRLYVVGVDGRIAYKGGPGPSGFKINEVENWLRGFVDPRIVARAEPAERGRQHTAGFQLLGDLTYPRGAYSLRE